MMLAGRDLGVLDADSHFQEPVTWLADVDIALARRCPGAALLVGTANFVGIDPQHLPGTPFWKVFARWASSSTLADVRGLAENDATAGFFSTKPFDAKARIHWLDRAGIDSQICNPTVATHMHLGTAAIEPGLAASVAYAYNDWASAVTRGWSRLHPTALIDLSTGLDASVRLKSVAESGSLTYLLPIDEDLWCGLGDDSSSRLWREALDLGLTAVMHLGVASPTSSTLKGSVPRWADCQLRAQRCLLQWVTSLHSRGLRSGSVLVEELGIDWAIPWLRNLRRCEATPVLSMLGDGDSPIPSLFDAARSQVAWVPLPRDPIEEVLAASEAPRMIFGSDYPHSEGWGEDPLASARRRGWDPAANDPSPCGQGFWRLTPRSPGLGSSRCSASSPLVGSWVRVTVFGLRWLLLSCPVRSLVPGLMRTGGGGDDGRARRWHATRAVAFVGYSS